MRAEVSGGGMVRVEVTLESSAIALEGLIVTGQVGQAEAYSRQRAAASLRNIVSSDHIERFPDSQVPDVLRRIPGISAQPDRGETGFVFIRGLSPDFTTVTIDGTRVPSTDRTGRGTELRSIPAEMLESVEVIKAITPDMDADAVGGSINLTARQPTRPVAITPWATGGSAWTTRHRSLRGIGSSRTGTTSSSANPGWTSTWRPPTD